MAVGGGGGGGGLPPPKCIFDRGIYILCQIKVKLCIQLTFCSPMRLEHLGFHYSEYLLTITIAIKTDYNCIRLSNNQYVHNMSSY